MFSLPIRNGGLGIPVIRDKAGNDFHSSIQLTAPLAAIMAIQGQSLPNLEEVEQAKLDVKHQNRAIQHQKEGFIREALSEPTRKALDQAKEKGASNWLSALPLVNQGFTLNKGEFRDALAIRYNKALRGLPSKCPCGQKFDLNHALNCKRGGFVIMRHNTIRDFEANLLKQICTDVETEPPLQPLDGENLPGLTGDEARPDVRARGFW